MSESGNKPQIQPENHLPEPDATRPDQETPDPENPGQVETAEDAEAAEAMRQGAIEEHQFLMFFYKVFWVCGVVGSLACLAVGPPQAGSFAFGFGSIATILFLWHLAVDRLVKPRKTSSATQTLLVFIRYVLLGSVFYGIISLFAVRWPWFVAGTLTLMTGLLISTALFKRSTGTN